MCCQKSTSRIILVMHQFWYNSNIFIFTFPVIKEMGPLHCCYCKKPNWPIGQKAVHRYPIALKIHKKVHTPWAARKFHPMAPSSPLGGNMEEITKQLGFEGPRVSLPHSTQGISPSILALFKLGSNQASLHISPHFLPMGQVRGVNFSVAAQHV